MAKINTLKGKLGSISFGMYILVGLFIAVVILGLGFIFFDNIKTAFKDNKNETSINNNTYISVSQGPFPTLDPKVTCARFTNIEQALKYPLQACILDLTGQNLSTLPEDLSILTNLTTIVLNNNQFEEFPPLLLNLPKLTDISLANNSIKSIPEQLSNLKKLQRLDLSNNKLVSLPKNTQYLNSIGPLLLVGNNINSSDKKRVMAIYKTLSPDNINSLPKLPASPASKLK